ncbi:ATP-binding protein [Streptomyces sp. NPDC021096]|uniref:ATP-binding protein n=1 Tax=Streptomyces sp. NPDC021096 TaxID=3154792 RepID=UPI0033FC7C0A
MATVSPENRWSYSLILPHDPRSVRIARLALRGVLESHGMGELADVAELVVSEFVTNSYLSADGPAEVRLKEVGDGRIRISVWDTSPEIPAQFERPGRRGKGAPPWPADGEGGVDDGTSGLSIVRHCAESWGSWSLRQSLPGVAGKLLWCEVSPRSGSLGMAA